MPRERMKALHRWRRVASEGARGGQGSEGEMESRARAERERRKEEARGAKAPRVSRAKGTRRREEEVGKEEYLEILRASACLAVLSGTGERERYEGEEG